jgi:glycosyltransferase involved in cell wall biosynthesis
VARPLVTFIIATYRRADALRATLRSLQLQSVHDWDAIVVGDRCGKETEEAVRSMEDARIRYYNFPERYGEQTGPNNFGLHLADGTFLSFLNHDDLLLPDHLERSLDRMENDACVLHFGRAANARALTRNASVEPLPVFSTVLPRTTDLNRLADPDPYLFEPSSFWLVSSAYARDVGPWEHSSRLYRTPLRDWLMRAVKHGGTMGFGDELTGLRFQTQNARDERLIYDARTPEHDAMIDMMESSSPDEVRRWILNGMDTVGDGDPPRAPGRRRSASGTLPPRRSLPNRVRNLGRTARLRVARTVWGLFGIDLIPVAASVLGRRRGALHSALLKGRTGESIESETDIEAWIREPESIRVL